MTVSDFLRQGMTVSDFSEAGDDCGVIFFWGSGYLEAGLTVSDFLRAGDDCE